MPRWMKPGGIGQAHNKKFFPVSILFIHNHNKEFRDEEN